MKAVYAGNRSKKHLFSLGQRTKLVEKSMPAEFHNRIKIVPYEGVVADYINNHNIDVVIRGIRNATDFYTQHIQTNSSLVRMFFQL